MKVKEMARELSITEQTARLLLQQGKFGFAIKGKGDRLIYFVNEKEVREFVCDTTQEKQVTK